MGYPKTIERPKTYKITPKQLKQLSLKKRLLIIVLYQIVEVILTLLLGLHNLNQNIASLIILSTVHSDQHSLLHQCLRFFKAMFWVVIVQIVLIRSMKPARCPVKIRGVPLLCRLVDLFVFCVSSLPLALKALFICCCVKNNGVTYQCCLSLLGYGAVWNLLGGHQLVWVPIQIVSSVLILIKLGRMLKINWRQVRQPQRLRIRYLEDSCIENTLV